MQVVSTKKSPGTFSGTACVRFAMLRRFGAQEYYLTLWMRQPRVRIQEWLLRFVAESAADACALFGMAGHTATHGEVGFAIKAFALSDWSVALLARGLFRHVLAVAEENVLGDAIHAYPRERLARFRGRGETLNVGTLGLDGRVTLHASGGLRDGHRLAGIGVGMAHLALQLQRAGMLFMAERDGLRGTSLLAFLGKG
jgi:hypothetical protein